MNTLKLPFVNELSSQIQSSREEGRLNHIQVVLGPRQVGKTTGVLAMLDHSLSGYPSHYASADEELVPSVSWVEEHWQRAKEKGPGTILVIDEIQKVEKWSSVIKKLWDQQKREQNHLIVILLGSSSLKIQSGLSESLAGRYVVHPVYHWTFNESQSAFEMTLQDYIKFGGYPGSYSFLPNTDNWSRYIKLSIVDAVIGKDILEHARVKSPALFKQCFELINSYPAQEVSYTKLLGQLQGKGHVDQIKYYLELFEGAFLIRALQKYGRKEINKRSSAPKILPLCPAFFSAYKFGEVSEQDIGRLFEISVGSVLNRLNGNLFYWREGDQEVDFVFEKGRRLIAIEVKSGKKRSIKGLEAFKAKFPEAKSCFITMENFEEFSRDPESFLMNHSLE